MKNIILKNNFLSILKTLGFSMVTLFVLIGVIYVAKLELGFMPYLIAIFFIIDFPAWYLFVTYYCKTMGREIHIEDNDLIVVNKDRNKEKYDLSEIEYIEFFKSKSEVALHPSMNYSYIKIKLMNNKSIYITCLMTTNLKSVIELLKVKEKVRYGIPFLK